MKYQHLVSSSLLLGSLALAGCGGSSGGGSSTTTVSKTGVALSTGYLALANVCLDENSNKACDEAETVKTTTDANGAFSLDIPTDKAGQFALLAEAVVGTTTDGGAAVTKKFVVSAPKGDDQDVISPLTTLVDGFTSLATGVSNAEADDLILTDLGADPANASLFDDYLALATASVSPKLGIDVTRQAASEAENELLKKIAQVTAVSIQNNIEAAEAANIDLTDSLDSLVILVVNDVVGDIETLVVAIEAQTTFDAAALASEFTLDTSTLAADLAAQETTNTAVAKNMGEILIAGANLLFMEDNGGGNLFVEIEKISSADGVTGGWSSRDAFFNVSSGTRPLLVDDPANANDFALGATGWEAENFSNYSITLDSTGATATLSSTQETFAITGSSIDVVGQRFVDVLPRDDTDNLVYLLGNGTFPAGSEAYPLTFEVINGFFYINTTNDVFNGLGQQALTLNSMVNTTALTLPTSVNSENVYDVRDSFNGSFFTYFFELVATNATDATGTVNFYRNDSGTGNITTLVSSGTYERKTVRNEEMIAFELPADLIAQSDLDIASDDEARYPIYSVLSGAVKSGDSNPDGTIYTGEIAFNDTAAQAIETAWSNPVFKPSTAAALSGQSIFNVSSSGPGQVNVTRYTYNSDNSYSAVVVDTGSADVPDHSGTWSVTQAGLVQFNATLPSPATFFGAIMFEGEPANSVGAVCASTSQTQSTFLCLRDRDADASVEVGFATQAEAEAYRDALNADTNLDL